MGSTWVDRPHNFFAMGAIACMESAPMVSVTLNSSAPGLSPIHTADVDATKLSSCVASATITATADGFGDVNAAVSRDPVYT